MAKPIVMKHKSGQRTREHTSLVAGRPGQSLRADASRPVLSFRVISPASGLDLPARYVCASTEDIDRACGQAWEAFYALRERSPLERANLLERIGRGLSAIGDDLVQEATRETGLSPARLVAERERVIANCELLATCVRDGSWVEPTLDTAQASRRPMPKPDLRRMLRPLGPVAVMGSASSPIVTGPAGFDAMSALAAGCPVVYKAHPQTPGTGLLVAKAISEAIDIAGFHGGCNSILLCGGSKGDEVTTQLITHECIRAVGFTGARQVGERIAQIAQGRDDPIPVFAIMGGINPVFVLPGAVEAGVEAIAERLFLSITNAAGQTCAKPGLIFVARGGETETLTRTIASAMNRLDPQTLVSRDVRRRYIERFREIGQLAGVELRGGSPQGGHRESASRDAHDGTPVRGSPGLFRTTFTMFRQHATLHNEVFGPAAIVVVVDSPEQLVEAAASVHGCLAASIWCHGSDEMLTRKLTMTLDLRAGRIVYNGVPTGLELCPSLVHGGPYPASTQQHASAAGPMSLSRWTRPICYQNAPGALLPQELRDSNPLHVKRLVDGMLTRKEKTRKRSHKPPKAA
jgi:2,5-dioxopentanoate dehydrogenase